MCLRPAVLGLPGLHSETLPKNKKQNKKINDCQVALSQQERIERSQAEAGRSPLGPPYLRSFCPPPKGLLETCPRDGPLLSTASDLRPLFLPSPPKAIHGKNLVSILHLLVSLAMHFRAPIHLPEHVTVQVVVVRVSTLGRLFARLSAGEASCLFFFL